MIIVNGATGFVGRYLVDHLVKNGEKVVAVGRSRKYDWFFNELGVPFVQMDVTRAEEFSKLPTESVKAFVHLAALIPAAVQEITSEVFLNVNTLGTIRALEHCRKNNIGRFVYTTTLYEGMEHTELPITEEMGRKYALTGDHAAYVISKAAAADYVEHYSQEFGIRGIILRMTGLLGYGRLKGSGQKEYSTRALLKFSTRGPRPGRRLRCGANMKPGATRCMSKMRFAPFPWRCRAIGREGSIS